MGTQRIVFRKLVFGVLVMLCVCSSTNAQLKGVFVGDEVRILVTDISEAEIRGEVTGFSTNFIQVLVEDKPSKKIDIPIDAIEQLEVRYFISKKQMGTKIGAAIGGATAFIYSYKREIDSASCDDCKFDTIGEDVNQTLLRVTGVTLLGTITGGALGYLVGSQIKVSKWRDASLQLTTESLSPKYLGRISTVGLTLRYRF